MTVRSSLPVRPGAGDRPGDLRVLAVGATALLGFVLLGLLLIAVG